MNDDEFGRIERFRLALGGARSGVEGIGDDAALLREDDGRVVAMDTIVEGTHFDMAYSTWGDVGFRLLSTNVSDLWAMGAEPRAMLMSVALRRGAERDVVDGIAEGLVAGCTALDVRPVLVGGDTTATDGSTVLTLTMVGLQRLTPVPARSAARAGQGIWCLGELGHAAAGLAALKTGRGGEGVFAPYVAAHRRPRPPQPEWDALAAAGLGAMIDISDGLAADLWHIARSSGLALELDADAIEPADALREAATSLGCDASAWVIEGGDDYARIATCDRSPGPGWRRIGSVVADDPRLTVIHPGGTRNSLGARGYRHS